MSDRRLAATPASACQAGALASMLALVVSHASRAKLGRALVAFASIAHMGGYLYAAPEHVVDPLWPPHARFHVLQALLWIVGFDLVLLLLALGPLVRGDRWARVALLLAWPFVHVGYFVALWRGGGPPQLGAHLALLVVALLYLVGLGLAWRAPKAAQPTHSLT